MTSKDVTVIFSKAFRVVKVSINDKQWAVITSGKKGVVRNVPEGDAYLSWFVVGNPGDKFDITLENANKATTGDSKISRTIPKGRVMNGKTERINVK